MKDQPKSKEVPSKKLASLEQRETLFRSCFDSPFHGIAITSPEKGWIQVNDRICSIMGYSRAEIVRMTWAEMTHPDDLAADLEQFNRVLSGQIDHYIMDKRFIRKDGKVVWTNLSVECVRAPDGRVDHFVVMIEDITNHKSAEEMSRESEEKYRSLFEHANEAILVIQDGRLVFVNPTCTRMTGYSVEEFKSRAFVEFIHADDRDMVFDTYLKRMKNEEIPRNYSFRFIRRDGTCGWVEVSAVLIDWEGKPATLNFLSDITARRRADEALKESENKYGELIDGMNETVWVIDFDGNLIDVNKTAVEFLGYSKEELLTIGLHGIDSSLKKDDIKALAGAMPSDKIQIFETFHTSKDGRTFPVEVCSSLVTYQGKQAILSIARNITDRKRVEKTLKESEIKYRLLADNASDVIFVLDMDLNYTYVSPSVKILRGYEPAEVLKQQSSETLTPSSWDLALRTLSEVMDLEKAGPGKIPVTRMLQLEMVRKDGSTVWAEVQFSLIRDENQRPISILGVSRDISERKRAEEKLRGTLESLRNAVGTTIQVMVSAVEVRDPYTAGHQLRSADLARAIATEMGLPQEKIDGIRMAGSIHDIGKLSVPAEILSKPTKLTDIEFSLIKEHSQKGYEMLKDVESPWPLAQIVYQHHERMNGSGYPRNLKGDEILVEARILAVSDVVESMASHRPYRPALGVEAALEEIEKNKGILYDNNVAEACLRIFREKGYRLPWDVEENPMIRAAFRR
jgi:PAS domain S-box-containing protein